MYPIYKTFQPILVIASIMFIILSNQSDDDATESGSKTPFIREPLPLNYPCPIDYHPIHNTNLGHPAKSERQKQWQRLCGSG